MLLQLCSLLLVLFHRMVGICWLSGGIRAWLQETYPVRHSHSEYPRQASCGSRRWHLHYPVPPAQHISWRSRRPATGCWRWMQDVVRQLVGFGMVPGHVMNLKGLNHVKTHGERFHWAMWPRCIAMFGPCYRLICIGCTDSSRFFRQCMADINFGPNMRLRSVRVADLRRVKDGAWRMFWRGVSQNGGALTIWLSQYFCSYSWPLYKRMISAS